MFSEVTQRIHDSWGWILASGVCLLILGFGAVVMSGITTVLSVMALGIVMLVGGLTQLFHAVATRAGKSAITNGLIGVLYGVGGFVLLMHPLRGALTLTFFIAGLLIVAGILKAILSIQYREFRFAPLALVNAVVSIILGMLIYAQWPVSGLWVIGTFLGINLIMDGFSMISLAAVAKRLPVIPPTRTPIEAV